MLTRDELEATAEACGVNLSGRDHRADLVRSVIDSMVGKSDSEALATLLRWEDHGRRQVDQRAS